MSSPFKAQDYTFTRVGPHAMHIKQRGYTTQTFTLTELWKEYKKTTEPNNPSRRYVIERAIEILEGKAPEYRSKGRLASKIK